MNRFFIFLLFFFCYDLQAQMENCVPNSPLIFDATNFLNIANMESFYDANVKPYSEAEVAQMQKAIASCNAKMENALTDNLTQQSDLRNKFQKITEAVRNVGDCDAQIKGKNKTIEEVKERIAKDLLDLKHEGIFIVFCPKVIVNGPAGHKNIHEKQAQDILAPRAVEELNGDHITRFSELKDFQLVKDIITSYKGGEVRNADILTDNIDYKQNSFVYVAKVQVFPLKNKPTKPYAGTYSDTKVLNPFIDTDYAEQLYKLGVSAEIVAEIKAKVEAEQNTIDLVNKDADSREQSKLQEQANEINRLQKDINELQKKRNAAIDALSNLVKGFGFTFDAQNYSSSAKQALTKINEQTQNLVAQWDNIKDGELQSFLIKDKYIPDYPSKSIVPEISKTVDILRTNYGSISKFYSKTVVIDFSVSSLIETQTQQITRVPKQVWIYPCPLTGNKFNVLVVVNFRATITKVKDSPKPELDSPKIEEDIETPKNIFSNYTEKIIDNNPPKGKPYTCTRAGFTNYTLDTEQMLGIEMIAVEGENGISDFYLGKYEITVKQWKLYCAAVGKKMPTAPSWGWVDAHPMVNINWNEVNGFCEWLSEITGKDYRLPKEKEWEYAAKGGKFHSLYTYSGSNDPDLVAWYTPNSNNQTHPVGEKKANKLGFFDMSGNAWEYCYDLFNTSTRHIRGGCYSHSGSDTYLFVSGKGNSNPVNSYDFLGFRLCRSL